MHCDARSGAEPTPVMRSTQLSLMSIASASHNATETENRRRHRTVKEMIRHFYFTQFCRDANLDHLVVRQLAAPILNGQSSTGTTK